MESGFDYFGARYYNRSQYRFVSVDPIISNGAIMNPQKWHQYSYCGNNPIIFVDLDGRSYLIFVRSEKKVYLVLSGGQQFGCFDAQNEVQKGARQFPNGWSDFSHPKAHPEDSNNSGSFGSTGFIGFWTDNHTNKSMGIHAGQNDWQHVTDGCIRTTREGMTSILVMHAFDPITDILVIDSWDKMGEPIMGPPILPLITIVATQLPPSKTILVEPPK